MKRLLALVSCVFWSAALFGQTTIYQIRINEVLAAGATRVNAAGHPSTIVEMYNPGSDPVNLAGCGLTDHNLNQKYIFDDPSIVPAGGFLTVEIDYDAPTNEFHHLHLNQTGDQLVFHPPLLDGHFPIDQVTFGQQLVDVSIGRYPDGSDNWTLLNDRSFGAPNTPAVFGDPSVLKINEWMAEWNKADYFEIYNPSDSPISMGGMTVEDSGHAPYTLPALTYIGTGRTNAFIVFKADGGAANDSVPFKLSISGDEILLRTSAGAVVDDIQFGQQAENVSQGRIPDGGTNITSFTKHPTPGAPNFGLITSIVVNELLTHTDLPYEDAVEFLNVTTQPINIGGWYMSDRFSNLKRYQFPANTIVPAGGFYVVYEYQFRTNPLAQNFTFNSAHGGSLFLAESDENGNPIAYLERTFPSAANGVSFGRVTNSDGDVDFVAMQCITFGVDHPLTVQQFRRGKGAPNVCGPKWGPAIINEIMYHPPDEFGTNNVVDEYIELRNVTKTTLPLYDPLATTNHYRIEGGASFEFNVGDSIPPNGYLLVVSFDPVADAAQLSSFKTKFNVPDGVTVRGPYSGKLGNGDDILALYRPDPPQSTNHPDAGFVPYILTDRVHYEARSPWPTNSNGTGFSLQRSNYPSYADEPRAWHDDIQTAGRANAQPLVVLSQPQSQAVLLTNNAQFAFVVQGTEPVFQWYYKNKLLKGATNAILNLPKISRRNAGAYFCVVTNFVGKITSSPATLTPVTPVKIVMQPRNTTAKNGAPRVVFKTRATGTAPIHYQWFLNGTAIDGATNTTLILTNIAADLSGNHYSASADNGLSHADSVTATLTVK